MEASADPRTHSTWSPLSLLLIALMAIGSVVIVSVGVALMLFGIWFFVFAGSSLPGA